MKKYSFFLLLLLISFRVISSEIEVINLHENKSLDQMVLENVANENNEINVETNESSENNIDNVVESNSITETEIEYTSNFITQNNSSLINSILNNVTKIKSKVLQSELNSSLSLLDMNYENKNNRDIFLSLINYFYQIGDISKAYELIKSRDISEDENLNFYNFLEINYLLSTSQLESACNFKNFLNSDLNSKSMFVDKIEIFCLILDNKLSEAELLNSIMIETEENLDENFQQLILILTNKSDYDNPNSLFTKKINSDLIFLYSAMARIAELPLNEKFLEVDPLNLAIPIILNKSTSDNLRLKAANQSFLNGNISIESLAALYQSLDFNSQQLNGSDSIIQDLDNNTELLMAYYFQYINVQIFPSERIDAIIKFWNFAKSKNLEFIAYSLTYKIVDSIDVISEYLDFSPQIAVSYIYNKDFEKAINWIEFYEKTIGIDDKIIYARLLVDLYSANNVSSVLEIISNNFETFSMLKDYDAQELMYTISNIIKNKEIQSIENNFENIFDDRLMPSLFISENMRDAIDNQNEIKFLIFSLVSINDKEWREIHPAHLKLILDGYILYKNGSIVKELILEIFDNYKIL